MPKRNNLFQEVVAVVYGHLAEGAAIEESAMLMNRLTQGRREVDVVMRTKPFGPNGHEFVIAVEAAARGGQKEEPKPIAADWVEGMAGKHRNLPTDKVILVSESGFTPQAEKLAREEGMIPLSPEILGEGDRAFRIVNAVRSLWPRKVSIAPISVRICVDHHGDGLRWIENPPENLNILTSDGSFFVYLGTLMGLYVRSPAVRRKIEEDTDIANATEDLYAELAVGTGPGWAIESEGAEHAFYLRDDEALSRIDEIEITLGVDVSIGEQVPLHHRRLAEIDVDYAFGEGFIGETPALIVATEGEQGGMLSIRLNPKYKQGQNTKKSKHRKKPPA